MERNARRNALLNLLTLVVAAGAGLAVARYGRSLAGVVSVLFMGLGALVCLVSWFQLRLEERERLEKLEFEELTRSKSSATLFNAGDSEVFHAQRSREQFERYFVPAFAVLLFLLQAGGGLWLLRLLLKTNPDPVQQPLVCLGLFGMFFLVLFLLGRYATNLARLEGLRLLRPGATYLLLSAYLCLVVLAGVGFTWLGFAKVDLYCAEALAGLLLLIGVETLINLLLELYRPRVKGRAERPMFQSRLVSLLGQPEGLITTAAHTLDYQFGFKVSETWIYRLFARWLPWLALGQLGVLLLSTTMVFIDPGEQAILERNGRFVAVLKPGAHFKFPWPVDRAYRYSAEKIQTVNVGSEMSADPLGRNIVLWTVPQAREEEFIVAKRQTIAAGAVTNDAIAKAPPVNLLSAGIPVQFQITNLEDWVYANQAPEQLLESIAYREVVRYLVSADLDEVMSRGRGEATETLRNRMQAESDRHHLGINIIFVGLQDVHPPVKVAPDYEKVVSMVHTTNANVLRAVAEAIVTNATARVLALKMRTEAQSEQHRQETNSAARAELFTNQLPAYLASPSVYMQRAYLDTFVKGVANARLYILLTTNTHNVAILNLEPKIRSDIADQISLPPPPPPAKSN